MNATILVVEDDEAQRYATGVLLRKCGYKTKEAENGKQAIALLRENSDIDLVLLDLYMPSLDGRETLKKIHSDFPMLPVIILTASQEVDDAVALMHLGAVDFLTKPANLNRLKLSIEQHLKITKLKDEVALLKRKQDGRGQFMDLVGMNGGLAKCVAVGKKAAKSDIPVLITGESGVGKEVFARAIHGESHRGGRMFVAINCGAIPENLMESILFGHEKGSFTGAISREIGKFREADGGTLFLDEVAELKPDMQTKLLRVLQQKEIQPVGGAKPVKIDVRILSATNHNLAEDVAKGKFREDLYYRLNVMPIRIPALRNRIEDIPTLANYLIDRFCATENKPPIAITSTGLQWLISQNWAGNVRELENLLFRAVVLSDKTEISEDDFITMREYEHTSAQLSNNYYISLLHNNGLPKTMQELEEEVIISTMKRTDDNITEVARILDMGISTIYKKRAGK